MRPGGLRSEKVKREKGESEPAGVWVNFTKKVAKKPNTMILNLVNTSIIFDSVRHILLTITTF